MPHQLDLMASFLQVLLIDTYSVNPYDLLFSLTSYVLQCNIEIFGNLKFLKICKRVDSRGILVILRKMMS